MYVAEWMKIHCWKLHNFLLLMNTGFWHNEWNQHEHIEQPGR